MMNLTKLALVSTLALVAAAGCKNEDADDSVALGSGEAQLVEDDEEGAGTDDDLEAGLDEPLSGATQSAPGAPADGATDDEVLERARINPGLFFQPAGCVVSTRAANTIKHVLSKCTGPWGMAKFEGTVTSTFVREGGTLTITHRAEGLVANGATISGTRMIVYTREGGVITKSRTGSWSGTTAKGKAITHEASFVTTYDVTSKCITRDGSAQTTIGGRAFERSVDGYARCGIDRGGCPESGSIVLSRTKGGEDVSVTLAFPGGPRVKVTRPSGREVTRPLVCNPRT